MFDKKPHENEAFLLAPFDAGPHTTSSHFNLDTEGSFAYNNVLPSLVAQLAERAAVNC